MSLTRYKAKRNFAATPEPKGKAAVKKSKALRFVVQEHHASRLHFDFRLEMGGVLKSWAVPKGPSRDPAVRRLAVQVEDHPLDYIDFSGAIPDDNYGAGEVRVWDQGTYDVVEGGEPVKAVHSGKIVVALHGKKLKGEFHLVRMHGEDNQWLMIKGRDDYADPAWELKPLLDYGNKNDKPARANGEGKASTTRKAPSATEPAAAAAIKGAKRAAMPATVAPMLATLVDEAPTGSDWIYELKWDGYRAVCFLKNGKARFISRNNLDFSGKFPDLDEIAGQVGAATAILDGEIVALDADGVPSFQLLQNRTGFKKNGHGKATNAGHLMYYAFDLIYCDGYDLTKASLLDRKELLRQILPDESTDRLGYSDHVRGAKEREALQKAAEKEGMEGIMAKYGPSPYVTTRSPHWLKVKFTQRQEVVIGGFTEPRGARSGFGALVMGLYNDGKLQYVGHTGGGFNQTSLKQLHAALTALETKNCPFAEEPQTNEKAHWVKPQLVCEVKFGEWTDDRRMRQPIFMGLRPDKKPEECVVELQHEVADEVKAAKEAVTQTKPQQTRPKTAAATAPVKRGAVKAAPDESAVRVDELMSRKTLTGDAIVLADEYEVKLTNLAKKYWPDDGYTKGDLLRYYYNIADTILPHLKDRPLILQRYPDGIGGPRFFQHNVEHAPPFLLTETVHEKGDDIHYAVCNNLASLLYLTNLGVIGPHTWHSHIGKLGNPDWLVFDLDPMEAAFSDVCKVALAVRKLLDEAGLESYVKTSGAEGLHIYLPLEPRYTYDQAGVFAELVARLVQQREPELVTVERSLKKRHKGQIYLDYLQNDEGKSIVTPYAVRARPGATVAAPLTWDEVKRVPKLESYTIKNMPARIKKKGDLCAGVLTGKQKIEAALKRLGDM